MVRVTLCDTLTVLAMKLRGATPAQSTGSTVMILTKNSPVRLKDNAILYSYHVLAHSNLFLCYFRTHICNTPDSISKTFRQSIRAISYFGNGLVLLCVVMVEHPKRGRRNSYLSLVNRVWNYCATAISKTTSMTSCDSWLTFAKDFGSCVESIHFNILTEV